MELAMHLLTSNQINYYTLPTYSPEFNPVELVFSYMKSELRKKPLDIDLVEAITTILSSITVDQVVGWYLKCGYFSQEISEGEDQFNGADQLGWGETDGEPGAVGRTGTAELAIDSGAPVV